MFSQLARQDIGISDLNWAKGVILMVVLHYYGIIRVQNLIAKVSVFLKAVVFIAKCYKKRTASVASRFNSRLW